MISLRRVQFKAARRASLVQTARRFSMTYADASDISISCSSTSRSTGRRASLGTGRAHDAPISMVSVGSPHPSPGVPEWTHLLLLLNDQTFCGPAGARFAQEV